MAENSVIAGTVLRDTPQYGTGSSEYVIDGKIYPQAFLEKIYSFWRQKLIEDELLNALDNLDLFPGQATFTQEEFNIRRDKLMSKLAPLWEMYDTAQRDLAYDERGMDELIKDDVNTLLAGKNLEYR